MKKKERISRLENYEEGLKSSHEDEMELIIAASQQIEELQQELKKDREASRHKAKG